MSLERRFYSWLLKKQNVMDFLALPLVISGILLHHTRLGNMIPEANAITAICFLTTTLLCGLPVIFRAYMALKWKTISIELLVSIAVIGALIIGEYSECGIVTFLFQFGNYLESKTLKKTRAAIKQLADSAPQTALLLSDGEITEIEVDEVEPGDLLLVKEGGKVAVDGHITSGEGFFQEAAITGEARPAHKMVGDFLYAGSILESGLVEMTASRVGEDTTYAKIIELVEEAGDAKSPVERFIDRFAKYYTPFVILAAAATLLLTRQIDTAVTVLVLACPGALVIGAPIANISGIGNAARHGILFKGSDVMHTFAGCDTYLFDKTGTLTIGDTRVNDCFYYEVDNAPAAMANEASAEFMADAFSPKNKKCLLSLIAAAESKSSHPLGKAIVAYAQTLGINHSAIKLEPTTIPGQGLITPVKDPATGDSFTMYAGNEALFKDHGFLIPANVKADIDTLSAAGKSIVLVGFVHDVNGKRCINLCLGISDTIREGAAGVIRELKGGPRAGMEILRGLLNRRAKVCMLTGDRMESAAYTAGLLGIDEVQAGLLPADKYRILCELQAKGRKVCFVGDGINDSPSITKADTGIAMGNGTDVAIECSDIVIPGSDISRLTFANRLARRTVLVCMENIGIAVGTVVLLLIGLFAGYIHMSSGMLIHELSILAVIVNGMRLLW